MFEINSPFHFNKISSWYSRFCSKTLFMRSYSYNYGLPSFTIGGLGLTLKLRVGRKGYIILPKAIREAVGIDEGDEVIVEIRDGIVIKPAKKKVDVDKLRELFRKHVEKLREIPGRKEPSTGELARISLEEEFLD